jgi:hypothetical protein
LSHRFGGKAGPSKNPKPGDRPNDFAVAFRGEGHQCLVFERTIRALSRNSVLTCSLGTAPRHEGGYAPFNFFGWADVLSVPRRRRERC